MPSELPSVRCLLLPFANPGLVFSDLEAMTAQEVVNAGVEVPGTTERRVSVAGPVVCNQQVFDYNPSAFQWLAIAVPDGQSPPSHYRLKFTVAPNAWNLPLPPSGSNLSFSWRQLTGQADVGGVNHDVFFWPQLSITAPERTIFEWPEST